MWIIEGSYKSGLKLIRLNSCVDGHEMSYLIIEIDNNTEYHGMRHDHDGRTAE